jgi:uncharacterized membrane protein YoaK (UPF0700 family)
MKSLEPGAARDLLLLSITAGSADAVGYLGLGKVFTSNMTGNLVLGGISLAQGHVAGAARVLYVLVVFTFGVSLGAWMGRGVSEKDWRALSRRLIGLEKIALFLFGLGWLVQGGEYDGILHHVLLLLLTLAMGLQATALYRLGAPGVGTTAITGTLTAFATGLINLMLAAPAGSRERETGKLRVRFQCGVILLYGCGAALEGFLMAHLSWLAGFTPFLVALWVALRPSAVLQKRGSA